MAGLDFILAGVWLVVQPLDRQRHHRRHRPGLAPSARAIGLLGAVVYRLTLTHPPNDNLGSFATVPLGQLAVVPIAATLGSDRRAGLSAVVYATLALVALAAPSERNPRDRPRVTARPSAIAKGNARGRTPANTT